MLHQQDRKEEAQHMAAKRPREEAPSAGSIQRNGGAQYIEERDADTKIVRNSPYGAQRGSLGWGTPFAPAIKCFSSAFPNIHIGISSLNGVPSKDREMSKLMTQFVKKFNTLEHCYPYHRMCDVDQWEKWNQMVDKKTFYFTVKANQYLTHTRMLSVDADTLQHIDNFFNTRCPVLGDHLGPVLVQLPPQFRLSPEHLDRIRSVAAKISSSIRIAVEFRHKSWFCEEVYAVLRELKWTLVVTHNEDIGESPFVITNPKTLYVRLHGAVSRYVGDYGSVLMQRWAEVIAAFVKEDPQREVFFFLNNNESQIGGLTSSVVDATCLAQHLTRIMGDLGAVGSLPAAPGRIMGAPELLQGGSEEPDGQIAETTEPKQATAEQTSEGSNAQNTVIVD